MTLRPGLTEGGFAGLTTHLFPPPALEISGGREPGPESPILGPSRLECKTVLQMGLQPAFTSLAVESGFCSMTDDWALTPSCVWAAEAGEPVLPLCRLLPLLPRCHLPALLA